MFDFDRCLISTELESVVDHSSLSQLFPSITQPAEQSE